MGLFGLYCICLFKIEIVLVGTWQAVIFHWMISWPQTAWQRTWTDWLFSSQKKLNNLSTAGCKKTCHHKHQGSYTMHTEAIFSLGNYMVGLITSYTFIYFLYFPIFLLSYIFFYFVKKKKKKKKRDILYIRDWSLITGRGGLQNGKIAGLKLFAPPPQDRVKLFAPPPLLKSGNFLCPPYNMAKTSSYHVKTTPKLFVPPLQHG